MLNKLTEIFRRPSAQVLAKVELEQARRSLLEAQAAFEYSGAMVDYHNKRIQRLSRMVQEPAASK
jgi:hypothetical protein